MITKVFKLYFALPQEQKQLLADKRLDAAMKPDEWINLFASINSYNDEAASARRFFGVAFVLALIGTFILLFVFAPAAVIAFALFVACFIAYRKLRARDLPRPLSTLVIPLVSILREDLEPEKPLSLHLDFRGNLESDKIISNTESKGGYPHVTETWFKDNYFSGNGTMADGTLLEWQVVDHIRRRRMRKRSASGKIKTKNKFRVQRSIKARIALSTSSYAVNENLAEGLQLKTGEKRNSVRAHRLLEPQETDTTPALDDIIGVIGSCYKSISPITGGNTP